MIRELLGSAYLRSMMAAALLLTGMTTTHAAGQGKTNGRNVVKVLRTTDKSQANVFVPRAFEVHNVNPHEISKFVEDAVRTENGLIGTYANPDDDFNSGVILVVVPEYQLDQIGKIISDLDRPQLTNYDGTAYAFVQMANRAVSDVHVGGTDDTSFRESLFVFGAADNQIVPDVQTNSFMITGAPSGVQAIKAAISDYDKARDQISMEVVAYEVDVSNDATLGLDFQAWKNGPGRNLFTLSLREFNNDFDGIVRDGRINRAGYDINYTAEFFDYLSVKSKARVVNRLKGTVLNGFTATFQINDVVSFFPNAGDELERPQEFRTEEATEVVSDFIPLDFFAPFAGFLAGVGGFTTPVSNNPLEQNNRAVLLNAGRQAVIRQVDRQVGSAQVAIASEITGGYFLEVVPTIARNNIDMEVQTSLQSFTGFDGRGIPQFNTRTLETTVRAADGESVVLGGLRRTSNVKMTQKVPILGSIPILGYLFGKEVTARKETTVFQVVTPTILSASGISSDDELTILQVEGQKSVNPPAADFFFEQYLLGQ